MKGAQATNSGNENKEPNAATPTDKSPSPPSPAPADVTYVLRLLLSFNFFFAPVRDGLAPLVSVFLVAVKGWDPGAAGVIWFTRDVSAILCQTFVGGFVDVSEHKRALLVLATLIASVAAVSVAWTQNFGFLVVKSIFEGVATCFVQPCKNAMALGLIGKERFDQVSQANEIADHSGSFCAIVVAGVIAFLSYPNVTGVFYIIGGGGLLACLSLVLMPLSVEEDLDIDSCKDQVEAPAVSERPGLRGTFSKKQDPLNTSTRSIISQESSRNLSVGSEASTFLSILKDRSILLFTLSVFFFHLGNAAVLPLLSQILAIDSGRAGLPFTCANIAIAQSTSVLATWVMGLALKRDCPYKLPLIVGYVSAVPARCCIIVVLLQYWPDYYALMATQFLDGIGAGTFGLSLPTVSRALTVGTGRFSFTLGVVATSHMVGAALSNLIGGYIVNFTSYSVGFIVLGVLGLPSVILAAFVHARPSQEDIQIDCESPEVFRPRGTRRAQEEGEQEAELKTDVVITDIPESISDKEPSGVPAQPT